LKSSLKKRPRSNWETEARGVPAESENWLAPPPAAAMKAAS